MSIAQQRTHEIAQEVEGRIRGSRAATLSFSHLRDFARLMRPSFQGRTMSRIQTARCLVLWACRLVTAEKVSTMDFFRMAAVG